MKKILLLTLITLFAASCANDEFFVNRNKCIGCGKCKSVCPNDMVVIDTLMLPDTLWNDDVPGQIDSIRTIAKPRARIRTNRCVGCGECQEACIKENGVENCAIEEK